jgi:hypothetical protein
MRAETRTRSPFPVAILHMFGIANKMAAFLLLISPFAVSADYMYGNRIFHPHQRLLEAAPSSR